MKVLSAAAFLTNLFDLERGNWDLSKLGWEWKFHNRFNNEAEAFAVVASIHKGELPDQTEIIRKGFRKPLLNCKSPRKSHLPRWLFLFMYLFPLYLFEHHPRFGTLCLTFNTEMKYYF
jgi:hypothetical protein